MYVCMYTVCMYVCSMYVCVCVRMDHGWMDG